RNEDVVRLLEPARGRFETAFGPNGVDTLVALYNLSAAYTTLGRATDAIPLLERVLAASRGKAGVAGQLVAPARQTLRSAYSKVGRYDRCADLLAEDVTAVRKRLPPGSLELADHL